MKSGTRKHSIPRHPSLITGWREKCAQGAALITAILAIASLGAAPATQPEIAKVLESNGDVWGEQAMARPEGPTYEFFEKLLPPLRYVNCDFRHYPIVLSTPFGPKTKARLVSNGSAINVPCGNAVSAKHWQDYPLGVTFKVDGEIFGAELDRLEGPTYELGYLPIVDSRYSTSGGKIAERVFAPVDDPFAESGLVVASFAADHACHLSAGLVAKEVMALKDGSLCDPGGHALAWVGDGWTFNAAAQTLEINLKPKETRYLAVFSRPAMPPGVTLNSGIAEGLHDTCAATWGGITAHCMALEVPEERVNRAWKSLIAGTLMIASGDTMYYSGGNVYQAVYEAECGDAVRSLLSYGFPDDAKRLTVPLLQYQHEGLDTHNAAFRLQLLAEVYWQTRDAGFVHSHRDAWRPAVDRLLNSRQKPSGLEPQENYCGDIHTQVDSLSANANAWRGLRDMAGALRDMHDADEAAAIAKGAEELRVATLLALDKSERRDVTPPFIPIALFGQENPYETITASEMGTYWNLMIPYVLGSGILDDRRTGAVLDYVHSHGGRCMGMARINQHSGLYANENSVDDLYSLRYAQALLRRDEVDRALVAFYGKLAQGLTRDTFIGGEGTGLIPEDAHGRSMYLPPNSGGNAFFLTLLREMLVRETIDETGKPHGLRLLFATPRDWLEDGKTIRLERAPTAFGPIYLIAKSELSLGKVTVRLIPPPREPGEAKIRIRLPRGWKVHGASVTGRPLAISGDDAMIDVTGLRKACTIDVAVARR